MAFEMLVGLQVTNDDTYTSYRTAMTPLLEKYGGGFTYDFKIAEVLKSQTDHPMNRVFTIFFRDEESKNAFFANEEYRAIKKKYFDKAVSRTTIIATYERT